MTSLAAGIVQARGEPSEVKNPKSLAVPSAARPDTTLNPLTSGTPSLSNASSPTFGGEACIPGGITMNTVVVPPGTKME